MIYDEIAELMMSQSAAEIHQKTGLPYDTIHRMQCGEPFVLDAVAVHAFHLLGFDLHLERAVCPGGKGRGKQRGGQMPCTAWGPLEGMSGRSGWPGTEGSAKRIWQCRTQLFGERQAANGGEAVGIFARHTG